MTDLAVLIDPTGINLPTYPAGEAPISYNASSATPNRTASGVIAAASLGDIQELSWECYINEAEFALAKSLNMKIEEAQRTFNNFEVVIYNLTEPFSEIGAARTRYKIPGTDIITQEDLGGGNYLWTYWIASQGLLTMTNVERMGELYKIKYDFYEGTKLTASMEA